MKSDPDIAPTSPRSSPVEVRRKLSLLEEKRAIFQRRFFDSSKDAAPGDGERREEERKRRARQISVRTFDTFSTLEGTFDDDDAGLGSYLDGIEEDCTESYDNADSNYRRFHAAMAMAGAGDHLDKVRSTGRAAADAYPKFRNIERRYRVATRGILRARVLHSWETRYRSPLARLQPQPWPMETLRKIKLEIRLRIQL